MLTLSDESAYDRVKVLRLHGLDRDAWKRYTPGGFLPYQTLEPGFKYNMTDVQASLGLHQLARLEQNLGVRRAIWSAYDEAFEGHEALDTPYVDESGGTVHGRHLYTLRLRLSRLMCDRNQFIQALAAENIGSGIHFVPLHLHRWYRDALGTRRGDFPAAEAIGDTTLSLPLSASMSAGDTADVIAAVDKVAARYLRPAAWMPGGLQADVERQEAA